MNRHQVYPNQIGHKPADEFRGVVRTGYVIEDEDTKARGLADFFAAVTHEEKGMVRFYVFTSTDEDSKFPNTPLWIGPYRALSEEILTVEPRTYHPVSMSSSDEALKPFEDFLNQEGD